MRNTAPFVFSFLLCLNWLSTITAQTAPLLTAEEAVQIALSANYDIKIVQADASIARTNNTKANAGMLPTVNLVANESFTLSTFQQSLSNGSEFKALGAPFNTANAGVVLNWTLYDGRRMYIAKKRLEATEQLGQLNVQNQVQQTAATVLAAYYEVARSQAQEKAFSEVITLNEERLRIAEARLVAGFAAQNDALQAKIDLNQRRSDLLSQQNNTLLAKHTLNRLLARDAATDFQVAAMSTADYQPNRALLLDRLNTNNASLIALTQAADIAAITVDETRTLSKPRVAGLGQVNALRADNGSGFLRSNTQAGITVGASFSMPLYSGGNVARLTEVARLTAEQSVLRRDAQRLALSTDLDNAISFYETQRSVLALEEQNIGIARENLNVSTERFRLGQTNGLETQTAQNTLEQSLFRRNLALFNLKNTEIRLRLLAGEL